MRSRPSESSSAIASSLTTWGQTWGRPRRSACRPSGWPVRGSCCNSWRPSLVSGRMPNGSHGFRPSAMLSCPQRNATQPQSILVRTTCKLIHGFVFFCVLVWVRHAEEDPNLNGFSCFQNISKLIGFFFFLHWLFFGGVSINPNF